MKLWRRRALTEAEIALGRSVFADEIAWRRVRVLQAPALGFGAMVPLGDTIVFSGLRAAEDFAEAPLEAQGVFVHELAHVWQAQRGVLLAGAKLRALGRKAYRYAPKPGARFGAFNIERQAEIARHLFLARRGVAWEAMPPRDWLEEVWAGRGR